MLTQTDMNRADAIFKLWDRIDAAQRSGAIYDWTIGDAGKWVRVDRTFIAGMQHAAEVLYAGLVDDDPELDSLQMNALIDSKVEELREEWEQYKTQQAEIEAERRNEQALYGPW